MGLKRLVPNYNFAFFHCPLGASVRFPCGGGGGGGGGGAQQLQCKSSAQCSEKQQSPCEGDGGGGGLKFEKTMLEKIKPTPKKKIGHRFPCILYFFTHPQPNNIGPSTAAF